MSLILRRRDGTQRAFCDTCGVGYELTASARALLRDKPEVFRTQCPKCWWAENKERKLAEWRRA